MKRFLKIVMIVVAVFATTSLSAQPGPQGRGQRQPMKPEEMAQMMTQRMTDSLNLSKEQQTKVYDLNLAMINNRPMMRRDQQQTPEQRQAARQELMKSQQDYRTKLKAILTEEQYAKWEKEQAARLQRGDRGLGFGPQMPPRERLNTAQDDQQERSQKKQKKNKKSE